MPMNRVQFQKGLSMPEFMDRYGTEEQCEQAVAAARWPGGFVCPACGMMQSRTSFRRDGRLSWQCAGSIAPETSDGWSLDGGRAHSGRLKTQC